MNTHKLLGWLTLAFLAVGLLVGLMPLSAQGVSCGSAFRGSNAASVSDLTGSLGGGAAFGTIGASASCDDKRSTVRLFAVPLMVIGLGVGVGFALTSPKPGTKPVALV